jgi:hypothetical protein
MHTYAVPTRRTIQSVRGAANAAPRFRLAGGTINIKKAKDERKQKEFIV